MKKIHLIIFLSLFLILSGCSNKNKTDDYKVYRPTTSNQAINDREREASGKIVDHKYVGEKYSLFSFSNGINKIDLNSDGTNDLVVASRRNNGTSPHGYTSYSFFIYSSNGLLLVQLLNNDDLALLDNAQTFEGADCFVQDIRIMKVGKKTLLLTARRDLVGSFCEPGKVRFDFYELVGNTAHDYMPDYWFQYRDSAETDKIYSDVNDAINKELKSKF